MKKLLNLLDLAFGTFLFTFFAALYIAASAYDAVVEIVDEWDNFNPSHFRFSKMPDALTR